MTAEDGVEQITIDVGIWDDVPAERYHADPVRGGSLNHSTAKALLPPGCPAKARYWQLNGRPHKNEFDFGRAAHKKVLGAGEEIVEVKANSWRTNIAKEAKEEARAAGKAPLLSKDMAVVDAMADQLQKHPVAAALLEPGSGRPEVTAVWEDETTKLKLRCRFDWLRHHQPGRRLVIPDYKTAAKGDPESFAKACDNHGYHTQGDHYLDAIEQLLGADAAFVFIVQEVEPPYVVSCYELDHIGRRVGAARNRWARDLYAQCLAADHWPGYVPDHEPHLLSLPRWVEIREGVN